MSTNYGGGSYGDKLYGGRDPRLTTAGFSTVPVSIEVFTSTGTRKAYYQSGSSDLLGVEFSLAETGCKDFQLTFASLKPIIQGDKIKIKLFASEKHFFFGVARDVIPVGTTNQKYVYAGFGLNDYFERIRVRDVSGTLSFANKTVNYIVGYLIDTFVIPNTLITKNLAKIAALNITVTSCDFKLCTLKEAFDDLKRIANSDGNDYIVGVDESGDFFFLPRSQETAVTLIVGKSGKYGITSYEPKDSYEAKTKYHVIRDDGTYYGAVTSTEGNDICEEKIQAPAGLSDADIANWAAGILAENEVNERSASVNWQIHKYEPMLLKADGFLRVISAVQDRITKDLTLSAYGSGNYGAGLYGGEQYSGYTIDDTLKIVDVKYSVSPGNANRSITLGARPPQLESTVIDVRKKLTELTISLGR